MKGEPIWIYQSKNLTARLEVRQKGILVFYPEGRMDLEAAKSFFGFLRNYSEREKNNLILLVKNNSISSIDMNVRIYVVDSIAKDSFIHVAASFGENLIFSTIVNIFTSVMSKLKIRHKLFKTEKEALDWAVQFVD